MMKGKTNVERSGATFLTPSSLSALGTTAGAACMAPLLLASLLLLGAQSEGGLCVMLMWMQSQRPGVFPRKPDILFIIFVVINVGLSGVRGVNSSLCQHNKDSVNPDVSYISYPLPQSSAKTLLS